MLKSQKHTIRIGEIRKRLGELSDVDGDLSDDQQGEYDGLRSELRSEDTKLAAALLSEQEDADASEAEHGQPLDAEQREYREILSNARIIDVVNFAAHQTPVVGATRDLQELRGLDEPHMLPLDLLADPTDDEVVRELRANTFVDPGELDQNVRPSRFPIFPMEMADYLAIRRSTTRPGRVAFPVWTEPTAGPAAVTGVTPVTATDWELTDVTLDDSRIQRSFTWNRSQAARFSTLETDLRNMLRTNMADGLDIQAVSAITGLGTAPDDVGSLSTFANYKAAAFEALDDTYGKSLTDVRFLVGSETLDAMSAAYESASNRENALDWLMDHAGGVRYTSRIAAKDGTSKNQEAIRIKTSGGPHAEQITWNSLELIRDPYTNSNTGTIKLTAVLISGVVVVRTAPYSRLKFKLEA